MATHLFGSEFLPALKTLTSPIEALLSVTSTKYVPAFKTLSKLFGTYFKALACYALRLSNSSTPYLLHVFVLAVAAALVLGLFAPIKAFYGPLRWGYLQYSDFFFSTYEILLNWWLCAALLSFLSPYLSSFLFPFLGFSILGAAVAAWFKVYQEYHKKLQDVISQSAAEASRATSPKVYLYKINNVVIRLSARR
ncbi:hypothetical protein BKA63DRAFT_487637 [Paraphoma chrysanthemicola]|nr:hypothetical protein BKA63DRAFT_487637 [Paraphoma chrysanthemicola]